nr:HRDC domain-containing protein [Bergeriella denitrificans]
MQSKNGQSEFPQNTNEHNGDRPNPPPAEAAFQPADEREAQLFAALSAWREKQAHIEGCAFSKILSDDSLADLTRNTPETDLDLQGVYGLGEVRIGKYGTDILSVCYPFSDGLDEAARQRRKRMRRLLEWLARTARRQSAEPHQVLSKTTLRAIAAKYPRTQAELAEIYGMDADKAERYGEDLLAELDE